MSTKATIANKMVSFKMRNNDFWKFPKHNLQKFNIVHVNFRGDRKIFFSSFPYWNFDLDQVEHAEHDGNIKNAVKYFFKTILHI